MTRPIYLDYNATTPHDPEVIAAMRPFLETEFGNPSSSHPYGITAKKAVETARSQVAALIGCLPREVVFTSGGTESINFAITGIARARGIAFHVDAAQSIGKIPVKVRDLGVDLLSVAGHKLYAPKGIGALFVRQGVDIEKFVHGAGQEMGKRAGTENVLQIVGLGKACDIIRRSLSAGAKHMQRKFTVR